MRTSLPLAIVALLIALHPAVAQTPPRVLLLVPAVSGIDDRSREEIACLERDLPEHFRGRLARLEGEELPESYRWLLENQRALFGRPSLGASVALMTQEYLIYILNDHLPGIRVLVDEHGRTGDESTLGAIAQKDSADYVVALRSLTVRRDGDGWIGRLEGSLYAAASDSTIAVFGATAGDENNGFTFTCDEGTLDCIVKNSLARILETIAREIHGRDPGVRNAQRLGETRHERLVEAWRSWDAAAAGIASLLPDNPRMLSPTALTFGDVSPDRTRTIAVFVEDSRQTGVDVDGEMTVIIGEGEPFEALGYVVWGMLHDGEWHFSRTDATTFGARSIDDARERYLEVLIRNGWFASGTAERNPDFWTSGPFETLVDPATLPDYDPESISDQIARRDMLGMFGLPRMVAERRAEREEARREAIRQEIERRWVGANYARLRSDGVAPYAGCDSAGWMRVLVDSAGTRAIVPMTVGCREEGSTLLYWVLLREDNGGWRAYEWTLPGRREVTTFAGPEVVDAISRYTEWNFSFPWLGNERFWREHVLARDGASFRYLRELTK